MSASTQPTNTALFGIKMVQVPEEVHAGRNVPSTTAPMDHAHGL